MPWEHGKSRQERGYGAAWTKQRAKVLIRDRYLCQPCLSQGRPTPATQVDHIRPKAQSGTDDMTNLQAICTDCHAEKTRNEIAVAQGRIARRTIGVDGWPVIDAEAPNRPVQRR